MRQKVDLNPRQTDQDMFQSLELGDVFSHAGLGPSGVLPYLRNIKKACIFHRGSLRFSALMLPFVEVHQVLAIPLGSELE